MTEDIENYLRIPMGYTTSYGDSTMGTPTTEEIIKAAEEMSKLTKPEEEMVCVIIPKGSKVLVLTPDQRILSTKEPLPKFVPTLQPTVP